VEQIEKQDQPTETTTTEKEDAVKILFACRGLFHVRWNMGVFVVGELENALFGYIHCWESRSQMKNFYLL
jgi:hypothetical protein